MDAEGREATSPWKLPSAAWWAVPLRSWKEASEDNIGLVAAGVAFYGFLALVPLLGAIVLFYSIFADAQIVIRHIEALAAVMPREVAGPVGDQLLQLVRTSDGKKGLGLLIALTIALFGARNGAQAIHSRSCGGCAGDRRSHQLASDFRHFADEGQARPSAGNGPGAGCVVRIPAYEGKEWECG